MFVKLCCRYFNKSLISSSILQRRLRKGQVKFLSRFFCVCVSNYGDKKKFCKKQNPLENIRNSIMGLIYGSIAGKWVNEMSIGYCLFHLQIYKKNKIMMEKYLTTVIEFKMAPLYLNSYLRLFFLIRKKDKTLKTNELFC